jgi:O-methyltransferase
LDGSDLRSFRNVLASRVKGVLFRTPLRKFFFPRYAFNLAAHHLCFLCECLERMRRVPGIILEVGCSTGATTVFLNKYMGARGIAKEYVAIDTFSGFVPEDVEYEVKERGKRFRDYTAFGVNRKEWFEGTMAMNGIRGVRAIEADANSFDYPSLGPVSFCLLDVDLYRPIRSSLSAIERQLSPGGMIVVDDCNPDDTVWDGADQAYKEYVAETGNRGRIVLGKLGIIEKARPPEVPPSTVAPSLTSAWACEPNREGITS